MNRVLGDLIQVTTKLADDLYCGGETLEETLSNWARVLEALDRNGLCLPAQKTLICPRSATILGWIWTQGLIKASKHQIAALAITEPPTTIHRLQSFIGAYKALTRVLPRYADHLHSLDSVVANKQSRDTISWSEDLVHAFKEAQKSFSNAKAITLPCHQDELWTNASVKSLGIGATLYIMHNNKLLLAGYFNAKLKQHRHMVTLRS